MDRNRWPVALATLFVVLLTWYVIYTMRIVRALRQDAETLAEIFHQVQLAVQDPDEGALETALFQLSEIVARTRIPIVVTGVGDTVLYVENDPAGADPHSPEGQAYLRDFARRLDAKRPPVGDSTTQLVHYGDTPEVARLRWIPALQVGGLLLTVLVGFTLIRSQRRAESERAWTSMARELAHQLGTPISSLQGWLEVLRLPPRERPGDIAEGEIAEALADDLVRLERISHRFELIGREPELESLSLREVVSELERYLQARLPRLGPGIRLGVGMPDNLPPVKGNEVLLAWALENVVKNALDALAGRGGRISIRARRRDPGWVEIHIEDTGPGVAPEVRDRLFEPGITTKSGGWGVGLALSRRIVEGVHGGSIVLLEGRSGGAVFRIRLPQA